MKTGFQVCDLHTEKHATLFFGQWLKLFLWKLLSKLQMCFSSQFISGKHTNLVGSKSLQWYRKLSDRISIPNPYIGHALTKGMPILEFARLFPLVKNINWVNHDKVLILTESIWPRMERIVCRIWLYVLLPCLVTSWCCLLQRLMPLKCVFNDSRNFVSLNSLWPLVR